MIELNLIPDVKREFIRAKQQQALVITVSVFVGIAAVGVIAVLGLLIGTQLVRDKLAQDAVNTRYAELQKVDGLSNMLTIQNQLAALSSQNSARTMDSRIFDVLDAINPPAPNNVSFSSVKLNPIDKTISLEGSASGGYVATDTLKKTILNSYFEYIKAGETTKTKVTLTNAVSILDTHFAQDSNNKTTLQFSMSFVYADDLFANSITGAHILGPKGQTDVTDSKTHVPDDLFLAKPKAAEGSN